MSDMWIEKPKLAHKCRVRIVKVKDGVSPFPWILVLPATEGGMRRTVAYPDWHTPWLVAGAIQDKRNRNQPLV